MYIDRCVGIRAANLVKIDSNWLGQMMCQRKPSKAELHFATSILLLASVV